MMTPMANKLLLLLLLLSGCVSERKRAKICLTCRGRSTDTTTVVRTERIRDTVLMVDPDSAIEVVRFLPCPDGSAPKIKQRESARGRKTAIRSDLNGLDLTVKAKVEPEQKRAQIKDTEVIRDSKRVEQLPCPEHSHVWYWVAIGALSVLAAAGWVRK